MLPDLWETAKTIHVPVPQEWIARLGQQKPEGHSTGRHEADYLELKEREEELARSVAQAVAYVRLILPEPRTEGDIRAAWRFLPSSQLGGDSFGYHDLDPDHFAFYLLDVCGHGVAAAMISVSILNTLRSNALPDIDFHDPSQVVAALNRTFPMDQHGGRFFTVWYGVYQRTTRRLIYCGGGHPPALVFGPEAPGPSLVLDSQGPMVGVDPSMPYPATTTFLEPGARLFLFSDGIYEYHQHDGAIGSLRRFVETVTWSLHDGPSCLDRILTEVEANAASGFEDDASILELTFA